MSDYTTNWNGYPILDPGKILLKTKGAPFEAMSLDRALTIPNAAIFGCECGRARMYGFSPVENRHPMLYCHDCKEHTTHDYISDTRDLLLYR